jgi:flagellar protein FlaG
MPTEVTTEGMQKVAGLAKTASVQKQIKVNVSEPVAKRQDLPPNQQPAGSSTGVQGGDTSNEAIEKKVEDLNSQVQNLQRDLHFSVDAESGRTIIRVIDSETKETIRTIPPEDISVIAQRLEKHSGVLFNTSV